jgi:hypothetical protein
MFRTLTRLLAVSALATGAAANSVAAGWYDCGECDPVYFANQNCRGCEQFYVVNEGPVYSGPGIMVSPGYHQLDPAPVAYPYVGPRYWYRPYDGEPHYYRRHVRYHSPVELREPGYRSGPRIDRHRYMRHMRVTPPLDPRNK